MPKGVYIRTEENTPNLKKLASFQFKEGHLPWNKGKLRPEITGEKHPLFGKHHSEETKKKMSLMKAGKVSNVKGKHWKVKDTSKMHHSPWNKGIPCRKTTKQKLSNIFRGRIPWNKGIKWIEMAGENHPRWKGGISCEPYTIGWTEDLRESIRKRDNYVCQECGLHQDELNGRFKKFDIHHIDYDKDNLDPNNLITLCKNCHMRTNTNREYWIKYFDNKLKKENDLCQYRSG